jgi:hypothetical protein
LGGKLHSEISHINMADLTKGVYFLYIDGKLNQVIKVIKK